MMYWNEDQQWTSEWTSESWTDTYDVLKLRGGFLKRFRLTWTDTYDVLKPPMNHISESHQWTWTDTYDVLKQNHKIH